MDATNECARTAVIFGLCQSLLQVCRGAIQRHIPVKHLTKKEQQPQGTEKRDVGLATAQFFSGTCNDSLYITSVFTYEGHDTRGISSCL